MIGSTNIVMQNVIAVITNYSPTTFHVTEFRQQTGEGQQWIRHPSWPPTSSMLVNRIRSKDIPSREIFCSEDNSSSIQRKLRFGRRRKSSRIIAVAAREHKSPGPKTSPFWDQII